MSKKLDLGKLVQAVYHIVLDNMDASGGRTGVAEMRGSATRVLLNKALEDFTPEQVRGLIEEEL